MGISSETDRAFLTTVKKEMHRGQGDWGSALTEIRGWTGFPVRDDHILERGLQMFRPFDSRLDNDVDRSAGHDQMLDVVALDE